MPFNLPLFVCQTLTRKFLEDNATNPTNTNPTNTNPTNLVNKQEKKYDF